MTDILAGIANPAIADVPGAFRRGRDRKKERLTNDLVAQILGGTQASKVAALASAGNPQLAIQFAEKMGFFDSSLEQAQNFIGTAQFANAMAKSGNTQAAKAILVESRNLWAQPELGLPTDKIDGMIQLMDEDPKQATEALGLMVDAFVEQGLAKDPGVDKSVSEIRKETRASLRTQLKGISKQASTLATDFNKIQSLVEEVGKGNRQATAAALIALVRLGDPTSVVRENEMRASLNVQNPTAAIFDLLRGNNVSEDVTNAVVASLDPLNPKNVKVDNLIATANSLVTASVPLIQSAFSEAREQGEDNLTKAGFKSIFTKRLTERVSGLSDLLTATPTTDELPEGTVNNGDGTFTLPTGERVRRKQ